MQRVISQNGLEYGSLKAIPSTLHLVLVVVEGLLVDLVDDAALCLVLGSLSVEEAVVRVQGVSYAFKGCGGEGLQGMDSDREPGK